MLQELCGGAEQCVDWPYNVMNQALHNCLRLVSKVVWYSDGIFTIPL